MVDVFVLGSVNQDVALKVERRPNRARRSH